MKTTTTDKVTAKVNAAFPQAVWTKAVTPITQTFRGKTWTTLRGEFTINGQAHAVITEGAKATVANLSTGRTVATEVRGKLVVA